MIIQKITLIASFLLLGFAGFAQSRYISKDVIIQNDSISLAGTLSMPLSGKPDKAIIIVSGTGKQDRDGTMAGHKIFAEIADYLANRNIAVLRTDDRGTGMSTGKYEYATTDDFASDLLAEVSFLKKQKGINFKRIGVLGHSEGGAVISIAASKSSDIKFLVSMAGLATNGYESLIEQNEAIVASGPQTDMDKKRSNEINSIMFKAVYEHANSDSLVSILNRTYLDWKVKDDSVFKASGIQFDHFRFPIYSYANYAAGPWYRFFVKYNAEETIAKVRVPILALNGDKDVFVLPVNLERWQKYAQAGGNKTVKIVLIKGVNHLFLPCEKCTSQEVFSIKAPVSQEALSLIYTWLTDLKI